MKRVLVTEGRVIHRDNMGKLHCGYQGDEMIIPDAVYERNKRRVEILEEGPDRAETVTPIAQTITAVGGQDAVQSGRIGIVLTDAIAPRVKRWL